MLNSDQQEKLAILCKACHADSPAAPEAFGGEMQQRYNFGGEHGSSVGEEGKGKGKAGTKRKAHELGAGVEASESAKDALASGVEEKGGSEAASEQKAKDEQQHPEPAKDDARSTNGNQEHNDEAKDP